MSMTSFKNNIDNIQKDLAEHHRNREQLKQIYIQERLSQSLKSYYSSVEQSFKYLSNRDENNLLKKYRRVMDE